VNAGQHRSKPLRRRLFAWFGVAIVMSVAFGVGLGWLFGLATHHEHHPHPIEQFAAARVGEQWQNVTTRTAILREIGEKLTFGVVLRDTTGKVIEAHGADCGARKENVPIVDAQGVALGELAVCPPRGPTGGGGPVGQGGPPQRPLRLVIGLMIALLAMWAASGRVARLLAKPLQELAQVADDLGQGKLSSRAALSSRHHGIDELDSLAHSINDMATRIETQLHDQKELLAAVSHELRTPLGHAKLLIEMARDQPNDPKPLDELEIELRELERMVGQLLASARLDFTALSQQNIDAVQLVVRVLERAGVDAARLQVDTEQTTVRGDPALLTQALANLVDNGRRHGGNVVALRLRSTDTMMCFDVLDDGPGFEDGQAETAFEPFQRGPASHGGLGLGLTLVRRIALAHNGVVSAGNRPEGGACVSLGVPLVKS
jgi:two-component system OmpR family sensor kinase